MPHPYRVFFAGPYSSEHRWLRNAVAAAARSFDLRFRAVDEVVRSGEDIATSIIREIAAADFAIVVLTDLRPNVLYELGRLHGSGIPSILVAPRSMPLPFDIRSLATIVYDEADHGELELSQFVASAIGRLLSLLTPEGRSRELEASSTKQTVIGASTVLSFVSFDFEGIRRSVEQQIGQDDCHTIEITAIDSVTFKGWQQRLRCPMGELFS